jgi:hypothetical protein
MKVQRKKRGDWSGMSENGFYVVIRNLAGPLSREVVPPARRMRRTGMEILLLRTRISNYNIQYQISVI